MSSPTFTSFFFFFTCIAYDQNDDDDDKNLFVDDDDDNSDDKDEKGCYPVEMGDSTNYDDDENRPPRPRAFVSAQISAVGCC